ncbi:DUF2244 domain-containing protein [Alphaproteobacteria bacterium]|nr:DUF2244 domain-containing protein [Alphaproteobacteria bacterium]
MGSSLRFVLRPNVSLTRRGFAILMGCFTAISFVAGGFFWAQGAWPVFGFFGLDVLLLYGFFRLNYRNLRRYEKIELKDGELAFTQFSPAGVARAWHFDPYWVRLKLERDGPEPEEVGALILSSHGKYVSVGEFLSPQEREALAEQLQAALSGLAGGSAAR